MGETIEIAALDHGGPFRGYLAGEGPAGIVVVQEIFGINAGIRQMVDGWAAQGYAALAPDLFWRLSPGVELDPDMPDQFQQAITYYQQFDVDKGIADIEAAIKALRARGCRRVGVVGYCLGGLLAFLAAARTDSDATVGYYGVGIDQKLGEAHAIARPLMLHIASEDHFVPSDAQAKVHAELDGHPRVTLYDYPADHAFARGVGASRVEALAQLADGRTVAFFSKYFQP